jgi:hypothetical protein
VLGREFSPDLLSRVVDLSPGVVAAARRAADRLACKQAVFQYQQALELLPSFLQGNKISFGETQKKEARPPRATPEAAARPTPEAAAPAYSGGRRPGGHHDQAATPGRAGLVPVPLRRRRGRLGS